MNPRTRIYLASRSPRRRELLHQIHIPFDLLLFRSHPREDPEAHERVLPGEQAEDYVRRVARDKATQGTRLINLRRLPMQPVLCADTAVEVGGEIIGKPRDAADAATILQRLSGTTHRVLSAVTVGVGERQEHALSISEVRFVTLSPADIARYIASGESLDKAGAYAIQGRAAAFVEEIRGSYSGIMGLPLCETVRLLRKFGVNA